MQANALRAAFPRTLPVMTGYLFLGTAFGVLLRQAGYGAFWALLMSGLIYAGSMQFVTVSLGVVLPGAVIAMLVVYCFKSATPLVWPHALPELIAGAFVVLVHHWKHNLVLSIGGGTVLYMLLVQLVFA